jgi:phage terminase large subunit-like protein
MDLGLAQPVDLSTLALLEPDQQDELLRLLEEHRHWTNRRLFYALYPDHDTIWAGDDNKEFDQGAVIFRRELYPRHLEHLKAGAEFRERCAMCANRIGKTLTLGAYETTCHLTGEYPHWWEGHRFKRPTRGWAAGKTNETTRDIIQETLFGPVIDARPRKLLSGTGCIPGDLIDQASITWKQGVQNLVDTVRVRHVPSNTWSTLGLKSYEQGRSSFEGTAKHFCIAEGQLVQMADGTMRPIERVEPGEIVLGLDQHGVPAPRRVRAIHDRGERDCIRLMPKQGTMTILTPDHEVFWGYRGQSKARADRVKKIAQMIPGAFWPARTVDREDAWYIWAALVITEGTISQRKVTNGDLETMAKATAMLSAGARVRKKTYSNGHVPDWHLYWAEFWDEMAPGLAHEKLIPDWVFTSSKAKVRLFLRWMFMGDGWVSHKTVGYATTSEHLATQITVLLSRLGIRSNVYVKRPQRVEWRPQFWVIMGRANEVLMFLSEIGLEGKEAASAKSIIEVQRRIASKVKRSAHWVQETRKHERGHFNLANARSRLKSAKVRGVEEIGRRRVFDLSVEGEHRFLVGTNLVSNCWLDEEPPEDVYGECLIRTATTRGIIYLTFTPLEGMSKVVMGFLPQTQEM